MPHLIKYGMLSTMPNTVDGGGYLVKAQCDFCGRKFGSIEAAKQCEREHMNRLITKELYDRLKALERSEGK